MGRILYCASTTSHITNFHLPYLEYFKLQGWQVDVAVGDKAISIPFADHIIELPMEKNLLSIRNLRSVQLVQCLLAETSYDFISTHTALAGAVVRLAVKRSRNYFGGKIVHTSHGYFFNGKGNLSEKPYLEVEKYLSSVTDVLMVMNKVDYQLAIQHKLGKDIVRIPGMGIDSSKFSVADAKERKRLKVAAGYLETDFLVVYAAEMSKRKNQEELIRAFARAAEQSPSMKLLLAGDGALKKQYIKLASKTGFKDRIRFLGHVSDMPTLYKMCDLAVSTSRSEGLPFNIMEAMACGLPVVASRIKGHTDLLGEQQNVCLYQLGDEKALTNLMLKFLHDRHLCEQAGNINRHRVQSYLLERAKPVIEKVYEKAYKELLKEGDETHG